MTAIHDATHHESLDITKPQVAPPDGGRRLPGGSTATRVLATADLSIGPFDAGNQGRAPSRVRPGERQAGVRALLGVRRQTDGPYYVGFALVPGGGPEGMTSPVAGWHVTDIAAKLVEATAAGAAVKEPVRDVGSARLEATVTDADGNLFGLLQDRFTRAA
jgi:hypothetical protein